MNKSLLSIGIVLSLGTVGCAGFGVQQSSSLSAQYQQGRGVDALWTATEEGPTQGLETASYAQQGLGDLWNEGLDGPDGVRDDGSSQTPNRGDLWNPASVSRSWEINQDAERSPSRGLLFGRTPRGGIWY
ncbi:MAG: hypothetical protein ACN4G0_04590 [Polyangiales bacterium]